MAAGVALTMLAAGVIAEQPVLIRPAVSAAAVHALVADENGELRIVDVAAGQVAAVVDTGAAVTGLTLSPDGRTAFVINGWAGTIAVVDLAEATVVKRIRVKAELDSAVVRPDGKRLYVTGTANGQGVVLGFDTASDSLAAVIQVGSAPTGIAISPDGSRLYVVNNQGASITVIDTRIATATRTVAVDVLPQHIAVSLDGAFTYVSHTSRLANTNGTVTVIDNRTSQVVAHIPVGVGASALAIGGDRLYVTNLEDGTVSVVDTATRHVVQTLVLSTRATAASPRDHSVYFTGRRAVTVVDGGTGLVTATIDLATDGKPATVIAVAG